MKRSPYELALESRVTDTHQTYRFSTADGVYSKRSFPKAELLLVEHLWNLDLGRFLSLEANYGVVGTVLADRAASVHMVESSTRAAQLSERNASKNSVDVSTTVAANITTLGETFDTVAYAPKPYTPLSIGQQHLANALSVLRSGGSLYLAASKQTGLTRYEQCLREVSLTVDQLSKFDDYVLLRATRPQSFDPPTYVSPQKIHPEINGTSLTLCTIPGLFSASKLDDGTRLLLETITLEEDQKVLDICCGYGPIGTYAGKIADCEVWLSDNNRVATLCAECSLRASDVDGTVITADCAEGVTNQIFDRVLCNPPTHAGSGVLTELFTGIYDVLDPDGELTIVHHADLDLSTYCPQFKIVESIRPNDEYQVLSMTV
ncbi:methyltransferase [Haloferacaceae archaeon DSL9]